MNNRTPISASATAVRCTDTLMSARLASTVTMAPATPPRLQSPWSRFITGVCRRALNSEPCTFIATSMNTSKNSNPTSPAINIAGVVAKPTTGSDPIDNSVPTISTRRVPKRPMTRPVRRLPINPEMAARVSTKPSAPIEIPTRSRISGNCGTNVA